MLNRSPRTSNQFFLHYFLFYATFIACLNFLSCNGVRKELIPEPNRLFNGLSEEEKEKYIKLRSINDDRGKQKIEKSIANIKTRDALKNFINKSFENRTSYDNLIKWMRKPERPLFEKEFGKADLDGQAKLINKNKKRLQQVAYASMEYQQHYMDLLEILSDKEAIELENKVIYAATQDEVNQVIASALPKPFHALNDALKKSLSELPDHDRQEILKSINNSQKNGASVYPEPIKEGSQRTNRPHQKDHFRVKKTIPNQVASNDIPSNRPGHGDGAPSAPDIRLLIKQKKQTQSKKDQALPEDEWGPKLSLQGEERKQFLFSIIQFAPLDQKYLKDLFDKVEPNCIKNFLSVYYTGFTKEERMELLATIIYLYKGWPALTIRLCNNESSSWDKYNIFRKTTGDQLNLLKKLDNLLQDE